MNMKNDDCDILEAASQAEASSDGIKPMARKRIGSTIYEVHYNYNPQAKETMRDIILRLMLDDISRLVYEVSMGSLKTMQAIEGSKHEQSK